MVASKIRYGAEVVRLEQKDDGVVINYTSAGKPHSIKADRVICTLPFTVLRGIKAEPQWSEQKARAIHEDLHGAGCSRVRANQNQILEKGRPQRLRDSRSTDGIWSPTLMSRARRNRDVVHLRGPRRKVSAMHEEKQIKTSLDLYDQVHPGFKKEFEERNHMELGERSVCTRRLHGCVAGPMPLDGAASGSPEGRVHFAGEHTSPWPDGCREPCTPD